MYNKAVSIFCWWYQNSGFILNTYGQVTYKMQNGIICAVAKIKQYDDSVISSQLITINQHSKNPREAMLISLTHL